MMSAALFLTGILPVIGGTIDTGSEAVGAIMFPDEETGELVRTCTATLVSPRVLLTAGVCVEDHLGDIATGEVRFGGDYTIPERTVGFTEARLHRYYPLNLPRYDLAVILLAEEVTDIPPVTLNTTRLEELIDDQDDEDDFVRGVGFGDTMFRMMPPDNSIRRTIELPVAGLAVTDYLQGESGKTLCTGDSGGPDFFFVGGLDYMIGVHADTRDDEAIPGGCVGFDVSVRVDRALDAFIIPAIDAWDGPCRLDGACVTDGCRTADPDCDPCGPDGTCADACPQPDWDCPLAGQIGEFCAEDLECESRRCIEAADDPRLKYCSSTCDVADALITCGNDMNCTAVGAESLCIYPLPTPGAQGSDCNGAEDCRSGLCDIEFLVCVEECDPAQAGACPDGFRCAPSSLAPNVCRPRRPRRGGGCGCRTSGGAPIGGVAAGILAVGGLLLLRRRRVTSTSSSAPPRA